METWVDSKDMKEAHPIETAEFARARGINNEPAFAWWVLCTLWKRDIILSKVKARIRQTTHKHGIEIPKDAEHACRLDKLNGNAFWRDALKKEMLNISVAFEVLNEGKNAPVRWSQATGHLVWDMKMDFTRKA